MEEQQRIKRQTFEEQRVRRAIHVKGDAICSCCCPRLLL